MTLLLDTHALLWFLTNDASLSERARSAVEDPANVTVRECPDFWEVAIKFSLGKLKLPAGEDFWLAARSPRDRKDARDLARLHSGRFCCLLRTPLINPAHA